VRIEFEIDDANLADWTSFENKWALAYIAEGFDDSGDRISFEDWLGGYPSSGDDFGDKASEIVFEIEGIIWNYIESNMLELERLLEEDPSDIVNSAEEIFYSIIDKISARASELLAASKASSTARA
jgi:hypothetical protein